MKKKQAHAIFYYQGNDLICERNLNFNTQRWFYHSTLGRILRLLITNRMAAVTMGWYHNARLSRHLVPSFIEAYQIGMTDFVVPANGYASFNDFFTRAFKPGARPLPTDPKSVISPADSKLFVIPNLTPQTLFFIKAHAFDLTKFLGNSTIATQFNAGTLCMFRLAPYDYHRFHAPVDGVIEQIIRIPGKLESVNPTVFMAGYLPLTLNERIVIIIKTPTRGTIAFVAVGATFVGSIILQCTAGDTIKRGDDIGMFAFGGSTVVMLFQRDAITLKEPFIAHSLQGYETAVTMGTAITN